MYRVFYKRVIDITVAIISLIITSPLFIIVVIFLMIFHKNNPFFIQTRPGKNAKLFKLIKFKTMTDKKDEHGKLLPDEKRITKMGQFIRKISLDELPQLINVIKGDMSLVGPRPLLPEYLPLYNDFQIRRHEVKPGITGWAQVNGRNAISWQQKFEYDVWYVNHISFGLDMKILFLTVLKVLKREDINSSDKVTMGKYKGN